MIVIQLNGEQQSLPDSCSIAQLLQHVAINSVRIAIEKNRQIVPKSQYEQTWLVNDDRVEIIQAIGGG